MENKKFCSLHRFWYSCVECPFCLKERTDSINKKCKDNKKEEFKKKREDFETKLRKLTEKYKKQ